MNPSVDFEDSLPSPRRAFSEELSSSPLADEEKSEKDGVTTTSDVLSTTSPIDTNSTGNRSIENDRGIIASNYNTAPQNGNCKGVTVPLRSIVWGYKTPDKRFCDLSREEKVYLMERRNEETMEKKKILKKLMALIIFTFIFMVVEFIAGSAFGALALEADAVHMASDTIGLLVGYYSILITQHKESEYFTFGWSRFEVTGAVINGVFLLGVCFNIIVEIIRNIIESEEMENVLHEYQFLYLVIAWVGLAVNLICLFCFIIAEPKHGKGHHRSFTQESMYIYLVSDSMASIAAIISASCVYFLPEDNHYKYYADPICSLIIVSHALYDSIPLLRNAIRILLQAAPKDMNMKGLHSDLEACAGVAFIHGLHVWQLNEDVKVATVHVVENRTKKSQEIVDAVKRVFHDYGIHVSAVQVETADPKVNKNVCEDLVCDARDCVLHHYTAGDISEHEILSVKE